MPSTDSDDRQNVDGMRRIQWPASTGLGGRHAPDSVAAFARIMQDKFTKIAANIQKH
ncbi:MAG: hypothetical protein AB1564_16850 [Chloroflexota bacterium]